MKKISILLMLSLILTLGYAQDDTDTTDTTEETTTEETMDDTDMEDTDMEDTDMEETEDAAMDDAATEDDAAMDDAAMTDGTIVDVAMADEQFSTLVSAIEAAGLVETLSGEGPFTVFAPTNAAFEAVEGLEELLAQPETLRGILLYHVVPGETMAADVMGMEMAPTAVGDDITLSFSVDGDTVMINDVATVTAVDIPASNGVIHVIDTVLTPTE